MFTMVYLTDLVLVNKEVCNKAVINQQVLTRKSEKTPLIDSVAVWSHLGGFQLEFVRITRL